MILLFIITRSSILSLVPGSQFPVPVYFRLQSGSSFGSSRHICLKTARLQTSGTTSGCLDLHLCTPNGKVLKMNPFSGHMAGLVVDSFLQYPVACSFAFCIGLFIFYPIFYEKEATKGWRWFVSCVVVFVLLSAVSIFLKPTVSITAARIIFRPTPSCSTFDNPARYLCFTFSDPGHDQVFYTTTWRKCDKSDANMRNASKFYIISSWIPSFDHFITKRRVNFEPDSSPGEDKKSYTLPENYCVRAAGPLGEDKLKVAFYSINGSQHHLLDSGYIMYRTCGVHSKLTNSQIVLDKSLFLFSSWFSNASLIFVLSLTHTNLLSHLKTSPVAKLVILA